MALCSLLNNLLPQYLLMLSYIPFPFDFCSFSTLHVSNVQFRFWSLSVSIHPAILPIDSPVSFSPVLLTISYFLLLPCFLALPGLCHRSLHTPTVQFAAFCIAKFVFSPFYSIIPLQLATRSGRRVTAENTRENVFLLFHVSSATTSMKSKSHPHPSALKSLVQKNSLDDLAAQLQKMMNRYEVVFVSFQIFLTLTVWAALTQSFNGMNKITSSIPGLNTFPNSHHCLNISQHSFREQYSFLPTPQPFSKSSKGFFSPHLVPEIGKSFGRNFFKLPLGQTPKLEDMPEWVQSGKCVGVFSVERKLVKEQEVSGNLKYKHSYQQLK